LSTSPSKRALAEALNHDSALFRTGREAIYTAGEPLLRQAQDAGVDGPTPASMTSYDSSAASP
jgi:hypothetical protein